MKGRRSNGSTERRTGRRRGAAALGALAAIAAWSCGPAEPVETAAPDLLALEADQVVVQLDHFITREGLRRARLVAETAYFLEDSAKVRLRDLSVVFFDGEGGQLSELEAQDGLYDMRTNDMEARGGVVVRSRRQFQRLETEHLRYLAGEDRLHGDSAFRLQRQNAVIRGTGFVSDPGLDTIRVVQPSAVSRDGGSG